MLFITCYLCIRHLRLGLKYDSIRVVIVDSDISFELLPL